MVQLITDNQISL